MYNGEKKLLREKKPLNQNKMKKKKSFFDDIEKGRNRFTLDDPMGKLVKELFDLTQFAKKLNQKRK
jgi:hypothetical protein